MFKTRKRAISKPSNFLIYCGFRQNYYLKNAMKMFSYKRKFLQNVWRIVHMQPCPWTRVWDGRSRLWFPAGTLDLTILRTGTLSVPIEWTFGVLLPTAVWPGLDAAHSPQSISESMDEWSCVPAPHMACTWTAIKFTFNLNATGVDSNSFTMPCLALPPYLHTRADLRGTVLPLCSLSLLLGISND